MKGCAVCTEGSVLLYYGGTCSKECARTKIIAQKIGEVIIEIDALANVVRTVRR